MPRLSCWFIRMALFYMFIGFSMGSLLLAHKGLYLHPASWLMLPLHIEFMLMGWIAQLIMGVAFWIFPRFWRSRGDERGAWWAFILLNAGIALVSSSYFVMTAWVFMLGRASEIIALIAFLWHVWSRIKAPGVANVRAVVQK